MQFLIYCVDDPATPNARDQHYPEHRSHLTASPLKVLVAGPYTEEATDRRIGSMLVVEAPGIAQARAFAESDPFFVNRVWREIHINPFVKNIDNR
ncbi:YciI family protein [Paraburkholderia fynbosensis]|uniref:YCII-related domain-containing protein n=1 Tax=Paraburkholderia fynbosensis TaxID=1200993 RepID=A0A6J5H4E5_9BURK|nr:YciI family protein [Paraburkholderia fynbosensis]CAB3810780.1 hypothetical protein LMG27177_07461 [Paraburkholderia fynbosensis]